MFMLNSILFTKHFMNIVGPIIYSERNITSDRLQHLICVTFKSRKFSGILSLLMVVRMVGTGKYSPRYPPNYDCPYARLG